MSELLPCPFCGGEADTQIFDTVLNVGCPACDIRTRFMLHDDLEQAIAAWNTRAERTCEMNMLDTGNEAAYEHYEHIMHCTKCNHEFGYVQYNEDGDTWMDELPSYCPNCGARVIGGAE